MCAGGVDRFIRGRGVFEEVSDDVVNKVQFVSLMSFSRCSLVVKMVSGDDALESHLVRRSLAITYRLESDKISNLLLPVQTGIISGFILHLINHHLRVGFLKMHAQAHPGRPDGTSYGFL